MCEGVAVCMLRCVVVAVYRNCGLLELVYGSCGVGELCCAVVALL